jgi:hypothetical protein
VVAQVALLVALKILKKYFEGGRLDDFSENTLRIEEKDEMMLLIAASLREINKNI